MKRLNKIQREYIRWVLLYVSDYTEYEDFSVEGIGALRIMCNGKDDENLPHLVNQFIKKVLREIKQFQKESEDCE